MASNTNPDAPRSPKKAERQQGFLPIATNTFDRVFISITLFVAINLLWFRFVEVYLSINFATVITLALAYVIIRWG